jgi:hypothetical protein
LSGFGKEILAHEIGHHVYCPADLTDNARLLARTRRGLPTKESSAPLISNLYADLLINDRLQRDASWNIAGVYLELNSEAKDRLWTLYMRTYELLWKLARGALAQGDCDERLNQDAQLGARLIRSCSKDWLSGAGRFAALCLPYLIDDEKNRSACRQAIWSDMQKAGAGGIPDGLAEIDEAEITGALHPAEDPDLSGIDAPQTDEQPSGAAAGRVPGQLSGRKTTKDYRQPFEYSEVLKAAGSDLDPREIIARYYRELAVPHLVPFPVRQLSRATESLPEGLEVWDIDSPLDRIDWLGTILASPQVVPGVTTRERQLGDSPGQDPQVVPIDLYLGIDCSGSMGDPAHRLSYPVLAGAIIALSALRVGSKVKVVLSGEPGRTVSTDGFVRDQKTILQTLTSYLGTGYSFGVHRLAETFSPDKPGLRPVHVLIISDHDMFSMLNSEGDGRLGWDVARESLQRCGGGGTFVLQIPKTVQTHVSEEAFATLHRDGWHVSLVNTMEELVAFAHSFSRQNYERQRRA